MIKSSSLLKQSCLSVLTLSLTINLACSADASRQVDQQFSQATDLFQQGKLEEAIHIEEKAVKEKRSDWLAYAALSYYRWRAGEFLEAISAARQAARLAPDIESVQTNLGQMALVVGDYKHAMAAFEQAKRIAPTSWVGQLGLARCYLSSGHRDIALSILHEMSEQTNRQFDWYYQIGETYLEMNEPGLAAQSAAQALNAATTKEQKSTSSTQLLLALIRDNQISRAKEMRNQVFNTYHPTAVDIYVLSASALLPVLEPVAGKDLLNSAVQNLTTKDSDAFFRLGIIFEEKARYVAYDATKYGAWMDNAEKAFVRACALNPDSGIYHLALAGTFNHSGKFQEMTDELTKAQSLDKFESLAPFLLAHLQSEHPANHTQTGQNVAPGRPLSLKLTKAQFKINGLSCACKLSTLRKTAYAIKGVAIVSIPPRQPYVGTILVDESVTPIHSIFADLAQKAFPVVSIDPSKRGHLARTQPVVTVEELPDHSPASVDDAIMIAQKGAIGDILAFPHQFKGFELISPVALAAASHEI